MGNDQSNTSGKSDVVDDDERKSIECKRPSFFRGVMKNIFEPSPQPQDEEPPKVTPPKHILWGCETPEEHYEKIKTVCAEARLLKGENGLRELGFQFQMVHHPETCMCEHAGLLMFDDKDEDNELDDDMDFQQEEEYMVPIGVPLEDHKSPQSLERSMTEMVEDTIDRLSHQDEMVDSFTNGDKGFLPRKSSNVSLFSLATHFTASSTASSSQPPPGAISFHQDGAQEESCAWRLYHIPSKTLVTPENHQEFIAHGEMYDHIARLCMEVAQQVMMEQGDLHWESICDARNIGALVSKTKSNKILLIVTGKGLVRAGIFSRRHLITTGIESSTALPLIREAVQRGMEIIMLDPNVNGHQMGMEVVEASLEKLFFSREQDDEQIYVVAHSMAGAQLVRFLHKHESSPSDQDGNVGINKEHPGADKEEKTFLRKIKAVAFTDSNHNINWTKNTPSVTDLLVGPSCLYIKSHKVHDEPKVLGEVHHDCQFWKHRFGDIKTLWAGTHEHALTNYTARFHIWDHFDEFLHPERLEGEGSGSDDEFQTYYGAEGLIE